jgi:hypothetical protein
MMRAISSRCSGVSGEWTRRSGGPAPSIRAYHGKGGRAWVFLEIVLMGYEAGHLHDSGAG